jgi:hypothetical protein
VQLAEVAEGSPLGDGAVVAFVATLVREPSNSYDENAVRVESDGRLLGHLAKELAAEWAPRLDAARASPRFPGAVHAETDDGKMRVWLWLRRQLSAPPLDLPIPNEIADTDEAVLLSEMKDSEWPQDEGPAEEGPAVRHEGPSSYDADYISPAYRPENRMRDGWQPGIPNEIIRTCRVCGERFRPGGTTGAVFDRCGNDPDAVDFCNPCMGATFGVYGGGHEATAEDMVAWLRAVAEAIQRPPNQNFPTKRKLAEASRDERERIVRVCQDRPSVEAVKATFGSWRKALVAAGLK